MPQRGRSKARGRQSSVSVAANYNTTDTAEAATGASMRAMNYMSGWNNTNRVRSARYDSAPRVTALVTKADRSGSHHLETADDPWLRKWHLRTASRRQHLEGMGLIHTSSEWEPDKPAVLRDQKRYARSHAKLPTIDRPDKYARFKVSADRWAKQQAGAKKKKARGAHAEAADDGEAAEALPAVQGAPVQQEAYDMNAAYEASLKDLRNVGVDPPAAE